MWIDEDWYISIDKIVHYTWHIILRNRHKEIEPYENSCCKQSSWWCITSCRFVEEKLANGYQKCLVWQQVHNPLEFYSVLPSRIRFGLFWCDFCQSGRVRGIGWRWPILCSLYESLFQVSSIQTISYTKMAWQATWPRKLPLRIRFWQTIR